MVWAWSQDYHREGQRHTILWDMPIHTDRTIAANRPDIVLTNKKDKTCLLIDMTIPLDTKTSVKTMEKIDKCKDLEIEVERMCGLKTTTVPVVMGALGTIKKVIENYTNCQHQQTWTLLSTAHLFSQTGRSSPPSRNPLFLPKSMVWPRMLREKITRNYTSISYIIIIQ